MKKLNRRGFTLIELLAVIIIMGILFTTAALAVTRILENARKDTFITTIKSYTDSAENLYSADSIKCNALTGTEKVGEGESQTVQNVYGYVLASALPAGRYYIKVNSADANTDVKLLEKGGKSPWGSRNIVGYIMFEVKVDTVKNTRSAKFYPVLSDGPHGVNVSSTNGTALSTVEGTAGSTGVDVLVEGANLTRSSVKSIANPTLDGSLPIIETIGDNKIFADCKEDY